MASTDQETTFKDATAVKATSSHTYKANFREDWCIGTVPHGGYVTCIFLEVAKAHFSSTLSSQNQPHTIALHLDFLRRTETGPALFTVQDTKLGRQASVIQITLTQSSRTEVLGVLTNSNLATESGPSFPTGYSLNPAPLPVTHSLLSENKDSNWVEQPLTPFSNFRRATLKTRFYFPRAGQESRSSADEWARLRNGEKWTNASIGYISDMWPMPVEAFLYEKNPDNVKDLSSPKPAPQLKKMWYPTMLLNLDIKKALPEEGVEWLFARVATKQIKNGRMDIEVVIMDAEGDIVALSHHIALAVDASRNVAARNTGAKI